METNGSGDSMVNTIQVQTACAWILNHSRMLSTHLFAHLVFFSFKIVFDWKLQCITNKATETNLNCPLDHQTFIFTCPKAKFACTCPRQLDLGYFLPCIILWSLSLIWPATMEEKKVFTSFFKELNSHTIDPSPKWRPKIQIS